jgi:hypothetical protein
MKWNGISLADISPKTYKRKNWKGCTREIQKETEIVGKTGTGKRRWLETVCRRCFIEAPCT